MVQFRRNSYDSSAVKKTIAALLEANCPAQGYPRHLSEAGGPDTAIIVTLHQPHASHCPGLVSRWAMAATRTPQDLSQPGLHSQFCKLEQPYNQQTAQPHPACSFRVLRPDICYTHLRGKQTHNNKFHLIAQLLS